MRNLIRKNLDSIASHEVYMPQNFPGIWYITIIWISYYYNNIIESYHDKFWSVCI